MTLHLEDSDTKPISFSAVLVIGIMVKFGKLL